MKTGFRIVNASIISVLFLSAFQVMIPASPVPAAGWYSVRTLHGIANSLQISEPDYTLQVANGSDFHLGPYYDPFEMNYTRNPTVSVCAGSIGEGCWWSEHIACGCGGDQQNPATANRVWHIVYADSNILEIQYNNTHFGTITQPRDNYTMVFFKSTDWFVWQVDQKTTSPYTGWNGFDTATSALYSSPALTVCLTNGGGLRAGTACTFTWSKTATAQMKEYQFTGITSNPIRGSDNHSIYQYPISSSSPYQYCAAGNNGEMKCANVPTSSTAGQGGAFTFNAGWSESTTFVIYPTYNDAGSRETNAVNLAKSLYFSGYGDKIGYQAWKLPLFCNPSGAGGATAQGCSPSNSQPATAVGNSYSWYHEKGSAVGGWAFINQTALQAGFGTNTDDLLAAYVTFVPGLSQNLQTNATGSFRPSTLTSSSYLQQMISGSYYATGKVNLRDIHGNVTVISKPNTNYYVLEDNSTVVHPTQITSLAYSLEAPGPTSSCDTTESEASSFVRLLNATTVDYEYKDATYGNWLGYTVGLYGHQTGANIKFITFSDACHEHPAVSIFLVNNASPQTYSQGTKWGAALYVLPHFGNITTVAQIGAKMTSTVSMEPEVQMYQKPVNILASPLALETTQSATQLLYVNKTSTGYGATMLVPPGIRTQSLLWNRSMAGPLTNVVGATLLSQTALSYGLYNVTLTWISTGRAKLLSFVNNPLQTSTTHSTSSPSLTTSTTTTRTTSTSSTSSSTTSISTTSITSITSTSMVTSTASSSTRTGTTTTTSTSTVATSTTSFSTTSSSWTTSLTSSTATTPIATSSATSSTMTSSSSTASSSSVTSTTVYYTTSTAASSSQTYMTTSSTNSASSSTQAPVYTSSTSGISTTPTNTEKSSSSTTWSTASTSTKSTSASTTSATALSSTETHPTSTTQTITSPSASTASTSIAPISPTTSTSTTAAQPGVSTMTYLTLAAAGSVLLAITGLVVSARRLH
ncbi:MAG TPA: hypothetical protein VGR53_09120 [Nitrososphaerales archaeon]|nr:hypothetical protein [Nitrososphaerales archaeon]